MPSTANFPANHCTTVLIDHYRACIDESSRRRRRRTRARAGVEACRASPASSAIVCAPGNAGHAAASRVCSPSIPPIPMRCSRSPSASAIDLTDRRSRAAAQSRRRRSFSRRGPAHLRTRRAPPLSSSAARRSRRISWRATACRRRAIASAQTPPSARAVIASGSSACPWSSRPTAWRRAKASSSRPTAAEAESAIRAAMEERQFGDAGARVVIEECLVGPEVSFFALCDGTRAYR